MLILGYTNNYEISTQAVRVIFSHVRKIKNASQYPLWRAYNLAEAVSRPPME